MSDAACIAPGIAAPESTPAHPNGSGRDALGRFEKGNLVALTHALRAVDLPPELVHLRAEIAAYEAACVTDEGGEDEVPTRRRSLLAYRARLHRRITQLDDALELRGLIDRRGKLRVNWLQRLEGLIATAQRLDSLLGLARRPKPARPLDAILDAASEEGAA